MKIRRLSGKPLEKVWGNPQTEPWFPQSSKKIGEVWFTALEEPRLLVKFLFTSEKLSVQVHPPDSTASPGKTEMWHILRSEPNASLALGFREPLTSEQLRAAALSGQIERLLNWHHPWPGETYFVPAGTVHAIGPGLALCEIQQYSDVTYRLYDYGRPRELHLDEALRVSQLGSHEGAKPPVALTPGRQLLVECPYFRTESIAAAQEFQYPKAAPDELVICLAGIGRFDGQQFAPGEVWVVPARAEVFNVQPRGPVRLLRVYVP